MRIAMLAPPWIPVPAPAYGGVEEVVRLLCEGLVDRGHEVTLFAAPHSCSPADVRHVLEEPHPDEIERSRWEVDHVARTFALVDGAAAEGGPFDVLHDHCGFSALAMADRLDTPLVHTVHGPIDADTAEFYEVHGHKGTVVGISRAQLEAGPAPHRDGPVVYNPLRFDEWPLSTDPDDHLLWVGRMAEVKGPHRAIRAAREAGMPLVLAGPVQPGQEEFFAREVEPNIDDDAVRYVGEVGRDGKPALFGAARALLMPIRWPEPFGLVMTEAMACGTPVIAFPEGSAPEVVVEGVCGFLVDDEHEMAAAVRRLGEIDRAACRACAEERFGVRQAIDGYERVYEAARVRARIPAPVLAGRAALPPRAPRVPRALREPRQPARSGPPAVAPEPA